jgi:hypothetical protein
MGSPLTQVVSFLICRGEGGGLVDPRSPPKANTEAMDAGNGQGREGGGLSGLTDLHSLHNLVPHWLASADEPGLFPWHPLVWGSRKVSAEAPMPIVASDATTSPAPRPAAGVSLVGHSAGALAPAHVHQHTAPLPHRSPREAIIPLPLSFPFPPALRRPSPTSPWLGISAPLPWLPRLEPPDSRHVGLRIFPGDGYVHSVASRAKRKDTPSTRGGLASLDVVRRTSPRGFSQIVGFEYQQTIRARLASPALFGIRRAKGHTMV